MQNGNIFRDGYNDFLKDKQLKEQEANKLKQIEESKKYAKYDEMESARMTRYDNMDHYINFCESVLKYLVTESLQRIFDKCIGIDYSSINKDLNKHLISNYVEECGAENLLNKFLNSGSYLLSEMGRCISYHYNIITEKSNIDDRNTQFVDPTDNDNFFKDLDMSSFDDVTSIIKTRVAAASEKFVQDNINDKIDLRDAAKQAKEQIETIKSGMDSSSKDLDTVEDEVNESFNRANRYIYDRDRTVYEQMIYNLSESVLTNEDYAKYKLDNGQVNMDAVNEAIESMYTLLEMVNTLRLENINESYISNILKEMK